MKDPHTEIDWRPSQGSLALLLAANEDAYLAFRCALTLLRGEEIPADDQARIIERAEAVLGSKEDSGEPSGDISGLSARLAALSVAMLLRSGDPQDVAPAFLALTKHLEAIRREETPSPGDADFPGLVDQETLSFVGFTCSLAASPERQRDFWAAVEALRDWRPSGMLRDQAEISEEQERERRHGAAILVTKCAADPRAYFVFRCAVALAKGEVVSNEDHMALAGVLTEAWGEGWRDQRKVADLAAHESPEETACMVAGDLALGETTRAIIHMVLYLDGDEVSDLEAGAKEEGETS